MDKRIRQLEFYRFMRDFNLVMAIMNILFVMFQGDKGALFVYILNITCFFIFRGLYNDLKEKLSKDKKVD